MTNPDQPQTTIVYDYDPAGNRISKKVGTKVTRYVRDASGNVMSVYVYDDPAVNNGKLSQTETHLYGSSRLGINTRVTDVENSLDLPVAGIGSLESTSSITFVRGKKFFELSNHLGNVLATVSDVKRARSEDGSTIDHYDADLVSAQDYYPFGMLEPGRSWNIGNYRYGFNGKENDNEVKGEGGQQDYGMRVYDPRIGKFLSVDPLTKEYPWNSTYAFAENDVIRSVDLDGAEKDVRTFSYYLSDNKPSVKVTSDNYVQPQGTSNIASWFGLKPQTPKERVAGGLVSSYGLPDNGTLSFFEFGPGIGKENYARYDYDIGGKQYSRYFDAGNIAFMYDHYVLEDKTAGKILNVGAASANLAGAGMLAKAELKAAVGESAAQMGQRFDPALLQAADPAQRQWYYYNNEAVWFSEGYNGGWRLELNIPDKYQKLGIGSEIFQREASDWTLSNFHAMWVESKDLYQKGLSDNLIQYRAAKALGLTNTEAAWKTWTGKQALKAGYNDVNVQELKNGDVHAVFSTK